MKDFFISSSSGGKVQIKDANNTTLPALIRLNQYEYKTTEGRSSIESKMSYNKGYLGSNYYDFAFIINHHDELNSKLEWLYNKIYYKIDNAYPYREILIQKKELTNNFLILEIPDYGAQAMSPFFTDFVPHIYINGAKLWQKYFCMLKHYSKKIVYILIEKNTNLFENLDKWTNEKIDIRICFKNNIEEIYDNLINTKYKDSENLNISKPRTTRSYAFSFSR